MVIAYVIYVFGSYHRIEDKQSMKVNSLNAGAGTTVSRNVEYTAGTYNVGFGAYTPDYSFFRMVESIPVASVSSQASMP